MALGYTLSALGIAWALAAIASLVVGSLVNITSLAPQYAASALNTIQDLAARLGIETTPTWASLRRDVLAQVNTQRRSGSTVVSVTSIVSSLVVVLLYVAFLLMEERVVSIKIANLSTDPQRIANLRKIIANINGRGRGRGRSPSPRASTSPSRASPRSGSPPWSRWPKY